MSFEPNSDPKPGRGPLVRLSKQCLIYPESIVFQKRLTEEVCPSSNYFVNVLLSLIFFSLRASAPRDVPSSPLAPRPPPFLDLLWLERT